MAFSFNGISSEVTISGGLDLVPQATLNYDYKGTTTTPNVTMYTCPVGKVAYLIAANIQQAYAISRTQIKVNNQEVLQIEGNDSASAWGAWTNSQNWGGSGAPKVTEGQTIKFTGTLCSYGVSATIQIIEMDA